MCERIARGRLGAATKKEHAIVVLVFYDCRGVPFATHVAVGELLGDDAQELCGGFDLGGIDPDIPLFRASAASPALDTVKGQSVSVPKSFIMI